MRLHGNYRQGAKHVAIKMLRDEACHISTTFGMLEKVRATATDGAGIRIWIGPSPNPHVESVYLWIPVTVVGDVTRAEPGNPTEAKLQQLLAQHVATHPELERCLLPIPGNEANS